MLGSLRARKKIVGQKRFMITKIFDTISQSKTLSHYVTTLIYQTFWTQQFLRLYYQQDSPSNHTIKKAYTRIHSRSPTKSNHESLPLVGEYGAREKTMSQMLQNHKRLWHHILTQNLKEKPKGIRYMDHHSYISNIVNPRNSSLLLPTGYTFWLHCQEVIH